MVFPLAESHNSVVQVVRVGGEWVVLKRYKYDSDRAGVPHEFEGQRRAFELGFAPRPLFFTNAGLYTAYLPPPWRHPSEEESESASIVKAVAALQANGIYHADPHAMNVFVNGDRVLLIDFAQWYSSPEELQAHMQVRTRLVEAARAQAAEARAKAVKARVAALKAKTG